VTAVLLQNRNVDRRELRAVLDREGINPNAYSIDGVTRPASMFWRVGPGNGASSTPSGGLRAILVKGPCSEVHVIKTDPLLKPLAPPDPPEATPQNLKPFLGGVNPQGPRLVLANRFHGPGVGSPSSAGASQGPKPTLATWPTRSRAAQKRSSKRSRS
jgi:hypothetical protein